MEIIKVLALIVAIFTLPSNSDETIQEYSYVKHTPEIYYGNDTIEYSKEMPLGIMLTQILTKHNLKDMDIIITYPDSIGYTIRK